MTMLKTAALQDALPRPDRQPLPQRDTLLALLPAFGPWLARGINATLSIRFLNRRVRDEYILGDRAFIGAIWHEHMLMIPNSVAHRPVVLMASRSRDGELSARFLRRLGHRVVRGSSSAGGADAFRRLVRHVRTGCPAVLTPDGPRGPAGVAKVGCVSAARDAGVPLIPFGCAISPAIRLANWDRTAIPCPFARVVIAYGIPIHVAPDAGTDECEAIRAGLDGTLTSLSAHCRHALNHARLPP